MSASAPTLSLTVRRMVRATPERVFEIWTQPEHLRRWWGPAGVDCAGAEIDARPGGLYRIGNRFADGSVLWIIGTFERVVAPHLLVFSWRLEPAPGPDTEERVSIRFEARSGGRTEVIVVHERIQDPAQRDSHAAGWDGCLDGLIDYLAHN